MGDYMEAATQASPGRSAFEQQLSLDCQYRLCLEFLRPIRSRILGLHSGNHEERLRNFADFDGPSPRAWGKLRQRNND